MVLIRSLLGSKKFLAMLSGIIGIVALKVFKVAVDPVTVGEIVGLVATFILAQGQSDKGKEAAKVTEIAKVQLLDNASAAQKIEAIKSI